MAADCLAGARLQNPQAGDPPQSLPRARRTRVPSVPAGGSLSRLLSGLSEKLMSRPSTDTEETSLARTRRMNSLNGTCGVQGGGGRGVAAAQGRAGRTRGLGARGGGGGCHSRRAAAHGALCKAAPAWAAHPAHATAFRSPALPHLQRDRLGPRAEAAAADGQQPDQQEQRHHIQ
jgi:hypothetical protein